MTKKTILIISDHPAAPTGVGSQLNYLLSGLSKLDKYEFKVFGGNLPKNINPNLVELPDNVQVYPVDDNYGDPKLLRSSLDSLKPDALILFQDIRHFSWIWDMEDEIHQFCPIVYWHVWDNGPYPAFNQRFYEGVDKIHCISDKTYELVHPCFPEKTLYIPHTLPKNIYRKLPEDERKMARDYFLKSNNKPEDSFILTWVNKNQRRKVPNDILLAWKMFISRLEHVHNHKNAILFMHTDPFSQTGTNLIKTAQDLDILDTVKISNSMLNTEQMNVVYNISDCVINIAFAEGFGLPTLEAMMTGTPIIANKTGGLTRQVVNVNTKEENGVALEPDVVSLDGSQIVPYIYQSYVKPERAAHAIWSMYSISPENKKVLSEEIISYVYNEFNYENMIKQWDLSLEETINKFKSEKHSFWSLRELNV